MLVYYFITFLTFIALLLFYKQSKKFDLIFCTVILVILTLFTGLRMDSDADYSNYYQYFQLVPTLSEFSYDKVKDIHGEIGYLLFSSIFNTIGAEFYIFLSVTVFISLAGKIHFYKLYVGNAALGFCLYLCLSFVNIEFVTIRWALATTFISLGLLYKHIKNYKLSVLFFIASICFHYFSILFILLSLINFKRINISWYFIVFFVVLIVVNIIKYSGVSFELVFSDNVPFIVHRIIRYLTASEFDSNIGVISQLKNCLYIFSFLIFFFLDRKVFNDRLTSQLFKSTMLIGIITLCFLNLPLFYHRSVVVLDILSIALILRMIQLSTLIVSFKVIYIWFFTFMMLIWSVIDINNKFNTKVILEYKSILRY